MDWFLRTFVIRLKRNHPLFSSLYIRMGEARETLIKDSDSVSNKSKTVSQSVFSLQQVFRCGSYFRRSSSLLSNICQTISYSLNIRWFSIHDLLFIDYSFDHSVILNFYFFLIQLESMISIPSQPRASPLHQPTAASDIIGRKPRTTYIRWATWNPLKINAKRKWFLVKYNNTGTCVILWISVIRERASKVISLAFSKLYYAYVVNDSEDRTRS